MHNVLRVAVSDATEKLLQKNGGVALSEGTTFDNLIEEFTTLNKLGNNVKTLGIFEVLVDLDNVGVVETAEDVNFVKHSGSFFFVHSVLAENFDSAFFTALTMRAETHFTESALTKDLADFIRFAKSAFAFIDEHFALYLNVCFNHCCLSKKDECDYFLYKEISD